MGYPVDNNPLEIYLRLVNSLRLECYKQERRFSLLCKTKALLSHPDEDGRNALRDSIKAYKEQIAKHHNNDIPPRTFDLYISRKQKIIDDNIQEHPTPINPMICTHEQLALKIRTFSNHSRLTDESENP